MYTKSFVTAAALSVGLVFLSPGVAAASGADPVAAEAQAKPTKKDPGRKVCRSLVLTGSRFSTRYCRTQEEWDRDAEAARRYLEDGQTNGYRRDGEFNGRGMTGGGR